MKGNIICPKCKGVIGEHEGIGDVEGDLCKWCEKYSEKPIVEKVVVDTDRVGCVDKVVMLAICAGGLILILSGAIA